MSKSHDLGDQGLRLAFEETGECPSIEELAAAAEAVEETAGTVLIRTHARSCVRCAAELELAEAFFIDEAEAEADDLAELTAAMKEPLDAIRAEPLARVENPGPRRVLWLLAAVVLLAVALWPIVRSAGIQPLPPPAVDTTVRGSIVSVTFPQGRISDPPQEFRWIEQSDASTYRVDLRRIDRSVIWSGAAGGSVASLPMSVLETLHRNTRYTWVVIGLDGEGRVVATSPEVGFVIEPEPEP